MKRSMTYSVGRYVATGAALGAYFGFFFRPQRSANLLSPILLGLAAALFTMLLQWLRKDKLSAGERLRRFLTLWLGFGLVLAGLELRHWMFAVGGRWLTLAGSAGLGALLGWWMSRNPQRIFRLLGGSA